MTSTPKACPRALVLNADYQPLSTWPPSMLDADEAVHAVLKGRVDVVETWPGLSFRSPSTEVALPKVVVLREYAPVHGRPKFCRRSIYLRDHYRCQYCGKRHQESDLTFDHVLPRSRGGTTKWENILTACHDCNSRKGDRTPQEARMPPLRWPTAPTSTELLRAGLEFLPKELKTDFGSWLYWSTELSP
jgi:5-methylcytosine-specific restriction endonuclease McrA